MAAEPGTSFYDLPDVVPGPDGPTVVEPEPRPEATPPPAQPQAFAYPVPVPVPMQQPSQADQDAAFMRNMSAFNSAREADENQKRMAEYWEKLGTPPPLPKDPEELISDPNKLVAVLKETQDWARRYTTENARMMAQGIANLQVETEAAKQLGAEIAVDKAREILYRQGYQDADAYWPEVEARLRQDPSKYWQLRRSPQALAMAVKIVRDERIQSGQALPVQQVPQAPINPAYNQAGSAPAPNPNIRQSDVTRVERVLGIKIRPETLRNA